MKRRISESYWFVHGDDSEWESMTANSAGFLSQTCELLKILVMNKPCYFLWDCHGDQVGCEAQWRNKYLFPIWAEKKKGIWELPLIWTCQDFLCPASTILLLVKLQGEGAQQPQCYCDRLTLGCSCLSLWSVVSLQVLGACPSNWETSVVFCQCLDFYHRNL